MNLKKLEEFLSQNGQPAYRLAQIRKAVYQDGVCAYGQILNLPKTLRQALEARLPLLSVQRRRLQISGDRSAHKAQLALRDGAAIETVLLNPKPGLWSACISSQAGCALKCSFCATGLMGLKRNLSAEEITDQILFWLRYIRSEAPGIRLSNVVYMGMGEPFLNPEALAESLRALTDPELFAFGDRHISVSTAGIAPAIETFALEFPQVNLALSLHAANDALRDKLVPVNKAYPLARLAQSLKTYLSRTGRKVFIEYVLLEGENDGPRHAAELAAFLKSVGPAQRLHVNLIVFNPTSTPHRPSLKAQAGRFKNWLQERGVSVTIRKNVGQDIDAACGQLITKI